MSNPNITQRLSNLVRVAFANRRGARRIPVSLPIKFAIVCQQKGLVIGKSRSISARTVDISRNGLSFETNSIQIDGLHVSVSPDANIYKLLELEVVLPEKGIQLKGLPLRYERDKETGKFVVGLKITAMPPEDRKAYEAFLKEKMSSL
ncbi:MAG TPA: PilZ domain-containing protein [Blastocatellia bacterium]|nr:PilZ domain-containing protein [Blastocatellia bacterium]